MEPLLRSDPSLLRFIKEGTATGKQLGIGSYGSVEEIEVNGLLCAGKKIHEVLIDVDNIGAERIISKYVQECQLMSNVCHPNITQFLGLCFLPNCQLPVLLMERLDGSLDDLLETIPNIPLALKRSILDDVASGLHYLHSQCPQIIHRDLTATNVLLTSFLAAKITDFGNSRIVNQQSEQLTETLSRFPGTLVYMAPEALETLSCYGPSLDVFSFGHLALFVGTQVFPGNLLQHNFTNPSNPDGLVGRSEVERRNQYFEQLHIILPGGSQHPLVQLIKDCLQNNPYQRPTAEQLVVVLRELKATTEGLYGELATLDAIRQVKTIRALKITTENSTNRLSEEIQHLRQQLEVTHRRYEVELHQKDQEIRRRDSQLDQIQVEIAMLQEDLRQKSFLIHQRDTQLDHYVTICQHQRHQLEQIDEEFRQRKVELLTLKGELQRLQTPRITPLTELSISLTMKWKRAKDMPFEMRSYPGAVLYKDKVHIGGGVASTEREMQIVMVYDPKQDSYGTLPPYAYKWFTMAVVNSQLVLVGGQDADTEMKTNKLDVWNEQSKQWTHPLPPMTTACHSPSVATHDNRWLVVIGGFSDGTNLSKVEILDTAAEMKQWHYAAPLPQPCNQLSAAVIGNMCYLLGGYGTDGASKHVFSVCLRELIDHAVSMHTISPWKILPDTPLTYSTALAFRGALLAVGGREQSKDIYCFQASSSSWTKAGELPADRSYCACITLQNGNLLVAGGYDTEQQVDIALVEYNDA